MHFVSFARRNYQSIVEQSCSQLNTAESGLQFLPEQFSAGSFLAA